MEKFIITDDQTRNDLTIFGKAGKRSVFDLFNRARTNGGVAWLRRAFEQPLSDTKAINHRAARIRLIGEHQVVFPFKGLLFQAVEVYLSVKDRRTRLVSGQELTLPQRVMRLVKADPDYERIKKGVLALSELLREAETFIGLLQKLPFDEVFREHLSELSSILHQDDLQQLLANTSGRFVRPDTLLAADQYFRFKQTALVTGILGFLFEMDAYIAVSETARELGYGYAEALDTEIQVLEIDGFYHPLVKGAVPNSVTLDADANVIFLTGANMAGKSTFMKSVGIALYLAHMGFPIPAKQMRFSVRDGIFTTINLPDNLGSGASHFYAEVLRIKAVARELGSGKNLFVIFDELFRGTNVKDAYDATVAVTSAFAGCAGSTFVISTHIVEAAEPLKAAASSVRFLYLPTTMDGARPVYTYRVQEGVTSDRHGMVIIRNEGIIEMLQEKHVSPT